MFPCRQRDEAAQEFARQHDAELALGRGRGTRWSLSPSSLLETPDGLRIVLPSLNGSTDDGGGIPGCRVRGLSA